MGGALANLDPELRKTTLPHTHVLNPHFVRLLSFFTLRDANGRCTDQRRHVNVLPHLAVPPDGRAAPPSTIQKPRRPPALPRRARGDWTRSQRRGAQDAPQAVSHKLRVHVLRDGGRCGAASGLREYLRSACSETRLLMQMSSCRLSTRRGRSWPGCVGRCLSRDSSGGGRSTIVRTRSPEVPPSIKIYCCERANNLSLNTLQQLVHMSIMALLFHRHPTSSVLLVSSRTAVRARHVQRHRSSFKRSHLDAKMGAPDW